MVSAWKPLPLWVLASLPFIGAVSSGIGSGTHESSKEAQSAPVQAPPSPPKDAPAGAAGQPVAAPLNDPRLGVVRKLLGAAQYEEARVVAEAVLKDNPTSPRAQFYAGLTLHKLKKYAAARPLLEAAMAQPTAFSEGPHVIHYVAWCAYYLGDLQGARVAFTAHLHEFPNYDDSHFGLGLVELEEDHLPEAEACFRRALELLTMNNGLKRERAKNLARLGDVFMREDRLGEAEVAYRDAVALWPDHYEAWARLSRLMDRLERPDEAATARANQEAALARMQAKGIPWRP